MKLVTFVHGDRERVGVLTPQGDHVLDLSQATPGLPDDMVGFLGAGKSGLALARAVLARPEPGWLIPLAEVTLRAPVRRPGKLICLGHNYYDHMEQGRTEPPEYPTLFCKTVNTIIGPGEPIVMPHTTTQVDYEAELAVVIGLRGKRITEDAALMMVAGYTIFNDVSARDYQKRTSQWMIGKSFDTFGPMGPAIVTADEVGDPQALELWLTLNGLELQRTNTRHMIFSVARIIAYLTSVMTLEPGDVISTGTPAKTALAKTIPPFMKPGDVVSIGIDKLGVLTNPVVAAA